VAQKAQAVASSSRSSVALNVAKKIGINPDLEKAISDLLQESMKSVEIDLEQKLKIIDRAINLEKLKQKVSEDEWGSGFAAPDDDT
jgi:hypothetical protein